MPCKLLHLHSETSPAFESLNQKILEESVPAACATQGYEPSRGAGVVEAVDKLVRQVEEQQEALERLNSAYASLVHERSLSAQLVVRLQHGLRTVSSKLALACMEETDKALLNVSESLVEINRLLADITETDSKVEGLSTISEARLAKPCASFEDSRGNSKLEVKMLEETSTIQTGGHRCQTRSGHALEPTLPRAPKAQLTGLTQPQFRINNLPLLHMLLTDQGLLQISMMKSTLSVIRIRASEKKPRHGVAFHPVPHDLQPELPLILDQPPLLCTSHPELVL